MQISPKSLHECRMQRIIAHWTAGTHKASALDRKHYHFIIEGNGALVNGYHTIADNAQIRGDNYAAHTYHCNSGSIGVSLSCMAGATEVPFQSGPYPMTTEQWRTLVDVCVQLCRVYNIPVTTKTVLSHAEVQNTLGIAQKGKWDIARLSFAPDVRGSKACGDFLRSQIQAAAASERWVGV